LKCGCSVCTVLEFLNGFLNYDLHASLPFRQK
jgi:hypothetical protein